MSTQVEQLQEESSGQQSETIEIRGLVLAPTREIAIQLHDYFNLLTKNCERLRSTLLIGGLDLKEQRRQLLVNKPAVVFATLGRLIEFCFEREWLSLAALKVLIMDEADKMVNKLRHNKDAKPQDTGKSKNVWQDLSLVLNKVPIGCKLAAYSATYSPKTLELIERRFGSNTVYLNASDTLSTSLSTNEHHERTRNTIPSNIKVYNYRLPQSVGR